MKIYIEPKFTNQISENHEPAKLTLSNKTKFLILMLLICGCMFALMAIGLIFKFTVADLSNPEIEYAFTLPLTQFGCLHYHMLEGETFSNWKIEQPTIIHVAKNSNINGIVMFNVCNWF